MIPRLAFVFLILALTATADGPEYGIYENLGLAPEGMSMEAAALMLKDAIAADSGFELQSEGLVNAPDLVREKENDRDGRRGYLLVFSDADYLNSLAAIHPKYVAAGLSRIGLHEEPGGLRITCLQSETLARIVGNDLDEDADYENMAQAGAAIAQRIRTLVGSAFGTEPAAIHMPPLRDTERIREGKKDMFMMVGPLTYFRKEGQFPLIYSEAISGDAGAQLSALADRFAANIAAFSPSDKDRKYRWTPNPEEDLRWRITARADVPGKAILMGITRARTEALAMHIAGMKRAEGDWRSQGLDHICAFPIEVLIYVNGDEIQVRSAKEMFRMDQYFWDAGKGAFMKYASMPAMLDGSIERALLGE
jgi:hypothetical protein